MASVQRVVTKSVSYTATADDELILCSGTITITLPPASPAKRRRIMLKKTDAANVVTADGNGAETIDGAATRTLSTQYSSLKLLSDGSNWRVV